MLPAGLWIDCRRCSSRRAHRIAHQSGHPTHPDRQQHHQHRRRLGRLRWLLGRSTRPPAEPNRSVPFLVCPVIRRILTTASDRTFSSPRVVCTACRRRLTMTRPSTHWLLTFDRSRDGRGSVEGSGSKLESVSTTGDVVRARAVVD
jgi:hypothetical protein